MRMNAAPATTAQRIKRVNMVMVPSVFPAIQLIGRGPSCDGSCEVLIFACRWSVNTGKHGVSAKDTFLDECWRFGAGAKSFRPRCCSIDKPRGACARRALPMRSKPCLCRAREGVPGQLDESRVARASRPNAFQHARIHLPVPPG